MSERSAAQTLFPGLPSANVPVDSKLPDPSRPAAQSIYGQSPNAGLDVAKAVTESGVARPAGETTESDGDGADEKGEPTITPFDASKFEGADPGLIADFGKIASKAGISQETADALMTLHTRTSETYWNNQQADWETAVKADKEIGGDLLHSEVVPAVKQLLADKDLVDPGFVKLLTEYRLGSHPAVIRTLYRLAQAL